MDDKQKVTVQHVVKKGYAFVWYQLSEIRNNFSFLWVPDGVVIAVLKITPSLPEEVWIKRISDLEVLKIEWWAGFKRMGRLGGGYVNSSLLSNQLSHHGSVEKDSSVTLRPNLDQQHIPIVS